MILAQTPSGSPPSDSVRMPSTRLGGAGSAGAELAMTGWLRSKLRSLPRTVAPVADETLASYLSRLAAANHVHPMDLREHLAPMRGRTKTVLVQVDALAAVTGLASMTLLYALPELRNRDHASDAAIFKGRTLPRSPNTVRLACRRCMAAKNAHGPVTVWMRHDQTRFRE